MAALLLPCMGRPDSDLGLLNAYPDSRFGVFSQFLQTKFGLLPQSTSQAVCFRISSNPLMYAETSEQPLSEEKRTKCLYIQKYKLHNENNHSAFFF